MELGKKRASIRASCCAGYEFPVKKTLQSKISAVGMLFCESVY